MKLFFFDTETTWTNPWVDHIIQFWGIYWILDENTKEFKQETSINQLINVDVRIPEEATAIHWIKNEDLIWYEYIDEYIYEFLSYLKKADLVVWHNVTFDINMLKWETDRIWIPFDYNKLKLIDTMKSSTNITKIASPKWWYKWPKLIELYTHLFWHPFENAHDAMADIQATKDCFIKLFNDFEYENWEFREVEPEKEIDDESEELSESSFYWDFAHNSKYDWSKNSEAMHTLSILSVWNKSIFLTWKAWTWKSTLIKWIIEVNKELGKFPIVLWTTWISALNIWWKTVHSFFWLGKSDAYYKDISKIKKIKISQTNKKLLKYAPFIVIDEISMISSNTLDVVDALMRKTLYNDSPFWWKQIIFVWDIYQLPPVCTQEWIKKFWKIYKSEWFFHSEVFKKFQYEVIELTHNYRQNEDKKLSTILDHIRENSVSSEDIDELNACRNNKINEDSIVLFSHNRDVDEYNNLQLSKLPWTEYEIESETNWDFPNTMKPIQDYITIKQWAKVMMITNDLNKRWVNWSIWTITEIVNDWYHISIKIEIDWKEYNLEKYTWKNTPLFYNENKWEFEEEILWTYTQFPIKLAYAITIHKSQWLTFEHCRMDISQVFIWWQAYTALSRVRSLWWLSICGFVSKDRLYFDPRINEFKVNIEVSNEWKKFCKRISKSSLLLNYTNAIYDWWNNIYIQCFWYEDKIKLLLSKFTNFITDYFQKLYWYDTIFFFNDDSLNYFETSKSIISEIKDDPKINKETTIVETKDEKIEDEQPELDEELFHDLVELRKNLTNWHIVYHVASDLVLWLLARYKPVNKEQFISIPWLKEIKYQKYWEDIINLIISHLKKDWVNIDEHWKEKFNIKRIDKNWKIKLPKIENPKKYIYWQNKYPWVVIVMKSWYFWSSRWECAVKLSKIAWLKLWNVWKQYMTWSTKLNKIIEALETSETNYIIIEDSKCIEYNLSNWNTINIDKSDLKSNEENTKDIKDNIEDKSEIKSHMQKVKEKHWNAYTRWTSEDDEKLKKLFKEWKTVEELMVIFNRNKGWIRSRLSKLWLIDFY